MIVDAAEAMRSGGGRSENGNDATPVRKEYGAAAETMRLCCGNDMALLPKRYGSAMETNGKSYVYTESKEGKA